jgi:hypothetical protein
MNGLLKYLEQILHIADIMIKDKLQGVALNLDSEVRNGQEC